MSRFNYVRYDEKSILEQESAKIICEELEKMILSLGQGRASSLALTNLEETYMWIGKQIRDNQVARNVQTEHKPERGE